MYSKKRSPNWPFYIYMVQYGRAKQQGITDAQNKSFARFRSIFASFHVLTSQPNWAHKDHTRQLESIFTTTLVNWSIPKSPWNLRCTSYSTTWMLRRWACNSQQTTIPFLRLRPRELIPRLQAIYSLGNTSVMDLKILHCKLICDWHFHVRIVTMSASKTNKIIMM